MARYAGNNLFNSFGNLAIDPEAALLFLDFTSGRRGPFTLQRLAAGQLLAARQTAHRFNSHYPDLTS